MNTNSVRIVDGRYGPIAYWVNDIVIGRTVAAYGEWCEREVDIFRLYCKPGDTVLDIGANIGVHTQALANIVGPHGRVVAAEPQKPMFMLTCTNAMLGGYLNIDAHRVAVGAERKVIQCFVPNYDSYNSFGGFEAKVIDDATPLKKMFIQVAPIDDLVGVDELVSFIKIDVEGNEADAIRGATRVLKHSRPVLYVENDRVLKSKELIELLWGVGYKLYWHLPKSYNEDNHLGNKISIWEIGKSFVNGQNWLCGVSVNMICLPDTNHPLPDDVSEIMDSSEHPTND